MKCLIFDNVIVCGDFHPQVFWNCSIMFLLLVILLLITFDQSFKQLLWCILLLFSDLLLHFSHFIHSLDLAQYGCFQLVPFLRYCSLFLLQYITPDHFVVQCLLWHKPIYSSCCYMSLHCTFGDSISPPVLTRDNNKRDSLNFVPKDLF